MLCSAWDHCRSSQSGWSTAFLSESESHKSKLSLKASPLLTLGSGDAHNNQATRNRGSPSINSFGTPIRCPTIISLRLTIGKHAKRFGTQPRRAATTCATCSQKRHDPPTGVHDQMSVRPENFWADLYRVNFEVTNLKPFACLAFPAHHLPQNTPKTAYFW